MWGPPPGTAARARMAPGVLAARGRRLRRQATDLTTSAALDLNVYRTVHVMVRKGDKQGEMSLDTNVRDVSHRLCKSFAG